MSNLVDLEPQAKAVVDANANPPYVFELGLDQGRRTVDAVQSGPVKKLTVDIEDTTVPGGLSGQVSVRILRPQGTRRPLPVIVYLHGAGWVYGNYHTHDRLIREFAVGAQAAVARACGKRAIEERWRMDGSGSGGGKVFGRFTDRALLVLDLAREEAERFGHRYLGPEHVLLGVLAEGHSRAAVVLRAAGVDLAAARAVLRRLAERGMVPAPQPSDAELLGSLGIDLDAVRRDTEQRFGVQAVGEATWRVTRRRRWRGARVVWTPLCGPPLFAKPTLWLASQQASGLGHSEVSPEHLLLGVLDDTRQPADKVTASRRHRQIIAHVGLPDGYRGAAGLLLAALDVDLGQLREAVAAEVGGVQR